jgi:hypothetical protein
MMAAALLIFPGLVLRVFYPEEFIILLAIAVMPIVMMIVRAIQGIRLFPHMSITWEPPAEGDKA